MHLCYYTLFTTFTFKVLLIKHKTLSHNGNHFNDIFSVLSSKGSWILLFQERNSSKQSDWETIRTWHSRNVILQNTLNSDNERTLMPVELPVLWNLLNSVYVGMCELKKAVTANICVKTFKYQITCSFKSERWVIWE